MQCAQCYNPKPNNILLALRTGSIMADNVISPFMGQRNSL